MSSTVRSLADIDLRGSLIFGKNLSDFPANPRQGQMNLISGALWVYATIDGVSTWYPLTNKKNSYVHIQAVSSFQWTVNHGLGTSDVLYGVYDDTGAMMVANRTVIDNNSFRLNFTSAVTGRVVVFADAERFQASIAAGVMTAASLNVASGVVTADQTGLKVSGQSVATLDGGVLNAAQIPTIPFAKLSGVPTTLAGLGLTDAYTKTQTDSLLAAKAAAGGSSTIDFAAKSVTVSGDILPSVPGVSNIGSPTQKFAAVYTKEMHIDANTLYVDGVPVIGSTANTINISADVNQGIRVGTTGTGQTVLDSQATTTIQTSGANANVSISAAGTGSMVQVTSNTEIRMTAPTVRAMGDLNVSANGTISGNLTVTGNLIVSGTQSQVNSTVVTVKDNIVVYNNGEIGSGVTNRYAGIQIDRGDLTDVRFVFDENDDKWKVGEVGNETALALASDLTPYALSVNTISQTQADARYLSAGITIDGGVL
jgi:hypothetical protein